MVQIGACAILFSAGGTWSLRPPSAAVWLAIVVTAVFASAFGYFIQTWVQAHISANRTALILATEPAWALVAAVAAAGARVRRPAADRAPAPPPRNPGARTFAPQL